MNPFAQAFGFLHWIGISHYLNLLLVGFMVRSGLEILSAHPKLYWRDDCNPGSEWLRLSRKKMPADRLWTGADEETAFSSFIALPGRRNLGMGRHWHFFCAIFWILNGLVYVGLLFGTGQWRRLVPTSWGIFPEAARDVWTYLHFHAPPAGHPYNAIQQLTYASVVFVLAPLLMLTGAAMSPAVAARFPWYVRLFGGRQPARSIHFLSLVAMVAFTFVHVLLVAVEDFPRNMAWIIHGDYSSERVAVWIGVAGLGVVLVLHVWATLFSLKHRRSVQRWLGWVIEPMRRALLHHVTSRQRYTEDDISPFFRVNGYPPASAEYQRLAERGFIEWRLSVGGLVEAPLELSLADLRALPKQTQITKHHCIQGWSAVGEWAGVAVAEMLDRCRPLPSARYLVLRGFDELDGRGYYETIDLELARHPQTLLAYEMNGAPLPIPHGAPCRLRVETQLGFKMVKYLRSIELVEDYHQLGDGQGGFREDTQFYGQEAGI
ncbi:oxidoreductase [Corallococcus interemptor]|uniref:Oxidoreductase n=1 Tax=Corallococcus interemptor TaxID=2316720 RepID=A0A3A8QSE4_9BACT|nr:molybdopterin-dependent oxidoreductase [Corallococcus interemptor]RKH48862.1 oxidoreductase [Corallococcus sp. AB050B]RKH71636.1 oxidoreductase [Corallococcus interemptor]